MKRNSVEAGTPYRRQVKNAAESDPEVAQRKCLACGFNFVSQWAGNRICDVCKGLWTLTANNEVTVYGTVNNPQKPRSRTD